VVANGGKRPTLKEVAMAAGVSVASASYALNGTGSVGEATRAHILEVAQRIGYRQNAAARAMKTGRSATIGLVLPDLSNPFFPSLAQTVIQTARDMGYSLFLIDTEGSEVLEQAAMTTLAERGVDGIIWFPVRDIGATTLPVEDMPLVVIDRTVAGVDVVLADYAEGGRLAAEHLIAMGHRRIGIVSGPEDISSMRQRCDGAAAWIAGHGELAFKVVNAFSIDLEPAVAQAIETSGATAVFAAADLIALGVIRHARARGLDVPRDLSVVGFDDIPWAELSTPPLTTIDMPLHAMAVEAVETLIRRIDQGGFARRNVVFNTSLVERGTVAPRG
jgi:LacI family transcriptional regulator